MNSINRTWRQLLALGITYLLFCMALPAHAVQSPIAKVIVSVGKVEAVDLEGQVRRLKRRSEVYASDTVMTHGGAKAQLRFTDGSMLALKPNSRFAIETYQYRTGDEDGKAVYNLLKGGMQTITGAIGRKNKENYALKTPTATIGIRGTYYQLKSCQGDCFNSAGTPEPDGLYGGVKGGAIQITNSSGSYTINVGEYFYMAGPDAPVVMLDKPPAILGAAEGGNTKQKPGGSQEGDGKPPASLGDGSKPPRTPSGSPPPPGEGSTEGGPLPSLGDGTPLLAPPVVNDSNNPEAVAPTGVETTPTGFDEAGGGGTETEESLVISFEPIGEAVESGGAFGVAFSAEQSDGELNRVTDLFTLDALHRAYFVAGNALSFLEIDDGTCVACQFESGTASLVDRGANSNVGAQWGRWQGEYAALEAGKPLSPSLSGLHYIYSANPTGSSVLGSITGLGTFDFFDGTSPTDDMGNLGSVDASQSYLVIDFDQQVFDKASLGLTLKDQQYLLTAGSTAFGSGLNTELLLTGNGLSGQLLTQFVGDDGRGISAIYNFSDGSKYIHGVGLFLLADKINVMPTGSLASSGGMLASAYLQAGATVVDQALLSSTNKAYLDDAQALTYLERANGVDCDVCQFLSADAQLADRGNNAALGVSWGRWVGDYTIARDGFEVSNLSDDYHFIHSADLASQQDIANTVGVASFDYVGGTSPTDQFGNLGSVDVDGSYVMFDFYAQAFTDVSYRFTLGGTDYHLSNPGPVALGNSVSTDVALQGANLSGTLSTTLLGLSGTGISGVYDLSGGGLNVVATGLYQRANRLDITPSGTQLAAGGLGLVASVKGLNGAVDDINDQFTVDPDHKVYVNATSAPTYLEKTSGSTCVVCQFDAGGAVHQDVSSASTGAYWGRWVGDFTVAENGLVLEPLGGNLHYIGHSHVTSLSDIQAQTGEASFTYIGGTSPTDNLGNTGSILSASTSLKVDFDAQIFSQVNLGLMLGGASYQLSNDVKAAIDGDLSTKITLSGSGLSGDLSAQFVGSKAGGVNTTYSVGSGDVFITGAAAFKREEEVIVTLPDSPRPPEDDGCGGCEGGEMEFPM